MLQAGRLPHACIISGARGTGKRTLARFLSSVAVCLGSNPPCGECEGCLKAEKDIHPDIERVRREREEISVLQVRSLRASLYTRANEAPRKVAIIEEADRMNDSAQNALLKILEEPPSDVLIIMITENDKELLPTISSRCVHFRMEPLKDEQIIDEIKRRLSGISDEVALRAARKSEGSLGRALELINAEDEGRIASGLISAVLSGDKRDIVTLALALEGMKREQISGELLELKRLLAGAAAAKYKKKENCTSEEERLLSERVSIKKLMSLSAECDKLSLYCDSYVGAGHISGALVSLLSEGLYK